MEKSIETLFCKLGLSCARPEQLEVISAVVKRDVLAILLTGFRKSTCFQCLPMLFDEIAPCDGPSVVM